MNVLSLFDGIGCGRVALERAGIEIDKYFASEIDKYAIKIMQKNYPDTIQLGDVRNYQDWDLPEIDLLIGGSPCQGFSFAGKQLNFDDPRSKLFFEFVNVLKKIKPKYFLLENVKMKKEFQDVISEHLGVEPIEINSALVSAQNRRRLYWTNIPNIEQPKDKGIMLKDIAEPSEHIKEKYWYKQNFTYHGERARPVATLHINGFDLLKRVYSLEQKCPTLTACRGGNLQKKILQKGKPRKLTPLEYERLQTLPEGYTDGFADSHRYNTLGDGWTVDVIAHIFSFIRTQEEEY